jgi:Tfp pilus assembly protein PilW
MLGALWFETLMLQLGGVGVFMAVLVFGLFVILMPLSMYAAQKWAYRTYQEVAKLNAQFETLLTLMRQREDQ